MVSPELQRTAIEDHCARRGYRIVRWIEGIDQSGSARRSPWWAKLDDAVGLVESGDADALVVWRFSRTARQRLRWAVAIDRVEVAGGLLESATEPLDTSTASGRLARGMLAEMAAYEAEVIGNTWREVHARRTSRGLPANGKPRFGYTYTEGIHRPDPVTGPILAGLYRRYVAGESMYSLVGWLNSERIFTVAGYSKAGPGPWEQTALRRVLDSGFGAGLITVQGERRRGIHEPIVDEPTWRAYQVARARRRTLRRAERTPYLLTGLVRCAHLLDDGTVCNSPMGGGQFGNARQPKYRCIAAAAQRRHQGGYVMVGTVEDAVWEWVTTQASDVDQRARAADARRAQTARRRLDAKALHREILHIDQSLARLTQNRAEDQSGMPATIYDAARDELLERRRVVEEKVRAAEVDATRPDPGPVAAKLLSDRLTMPLEHVRGTLRELVGVVLVTPGRPRSTVQVVPAWPGDNT